MKLRVLNQVLLVTFLFIGSLFAVMLFWGSQSVGISADEHIHMLDLGEWRWTSDPDKERHFGVYGLSYQLLGHAASVLVGIESPGVVGYATESFAVRHAVVATLTLLSAFCVGFVTTVVTRSKVWGLWSAVALLAIPPFLGHGFFNTKDIPTAAGYTLFTSGCVATIWFLRGSNANKKILTLVVTLTALGLWLAVGTRLGMAFPLILTAVLLVGLIFVISRLQPWPKGYVKLALLTYITGVLLGLSLVALTNPCIVAPISDKCVTGIEILPRVFGISSDYVWSGTTFIAGRQVQGQDPEFWYLPLALVVGTPVLILLLAAIGAVFGPENYQLGLRTFRGSSARAKVMGISRQRTLLVAALIVVGLQAALVPIAVILLRSTLYDLQRQFLFVYPAVAVFAGFGIALLFQQATRRTSSFSKLMVSLLSVIALMAPLYEGWRLWPYSYVYVNPVASLPGYADYWETDYWHVGMLEAMRQIPRDAQFMAVGAYWTLTPYVLEEIRQGKARKKSSEGVFVIRSRRAGFGWNGYEPDCSPYSKVIRNLRGQEIPIAFVSLCPFEYASKSWADTGVHPYENILKGA